MLCHTLALILLAQVTHPIRTAYVTSSPLIATIDRILEKLENLTVAPTPSSIPEDLSDDEEKVLSAMQTWGNLTPDQLDGIAKDLQRIKADAVDERTQRLSDLFYADDDNDEEYTDIEYRNDGEDDEDMETRYSSAQRTYTSADGGRPNPSGENASYMDDYESSPAPVSQKRRVIPSAITRDVPYNVISAVECIGATNKIPRIMDDSGVTGKARKHLGDLAIMNIARVVRENKCLLPQRKWLSVRQLVPASDTLFMPPWVDLHRCAPDSGCCDNEDQICAPVDGQYIVQHFFLHKAQRSSVNSVVAARLEFFNHTRCACVSRNTLQTNVPVKHRFTPAPRSEERQNDWRAPTAEATAEPKSEEDVTAPPQLRKCTCPTSFLASTPHNGTCSCGCNWRDPSRHRDCMYLARGNEHLGLRDRVCIENRDCVPPACEYGAYDSRKGKCPKSTKKRERFHEKRVHRERNVV